MPNTRDFPWPGVGRAYPKNEDVVAWVAPPANTRVTQALLAEWRKEWREVAVANGWELRWWHRDTDTFADQPDLDA